VWGPYRPVVRFARGLRMILFPPVGPAPQTPRGSLRSGCVNQTKAIRMPSDPTTALARESGVAPRMAYEEVLRWDLGFWSNLRRKPASPGPALGELDGWIKTPLTEHPRPKDLLVSHRTSWGILPQTPVFSLRSARCHW
jgi:hypothetical protein